MMGRATRAAALLAAALLSAACTGRRPQSHTVTIRNFTNAPATLTVAAGDTVVWTNDDIVPHTATARDSAWDSKEIAAGSTWRMVVRTPGRHAYYCVYHPNMQGVIEVR